MERVYRQDMHAVNCWTEPQPPLPPPGGILGTTALDDTNSPTQRANGRD